jgi:hypothetical protein
MPLLQAARTYDLVDWSNPINWDWSVNRGLRSRYMCAPGFNGFGTMTLRDLCRRDNGTLSNTALRDGWTGPKRLPGFGAIRWTASHTIRIISHNITGFPFTLSCWFWGNKLSDLNYGVLNGFGSDTATRAWFNISARQVSSTAVRFGISCDNNAVSADNHLDATNYSAEIAHHVVGVFNSATERLLYVDGKLLAARTTSVTFHADCATGSTYIGATNLRGAPGATSSYLATGSFLDDWGIWDRGLSADEVYALYHDNLQGSPHSLRRLDMGQDWIDSVAAAGGFKPYWSRNRSRIIGGGVN